MIDTHCHLTYTPISAQLGAVMLRARDAGVDRMITIGTSPDDAALARDLARRFDNIYFAAGLHPHYADKWTDKAAFDDAIRGLAVQPKFVALGEMGLDRHYPEPSLQVQRRAFSWQLALLRDLSRPAIIHNRQATDDTLAMIRDAGVPGERFVFHCFTGSDEELDKILELGAMVSFTGIITFNNSTALAASATRVPLDRIMIETDAPYLTPAPFRKVKVNEPCYVQHTARFLARQRGMSEAEFVRVVDGNAVRFFGLKR